jgi:hypothetical protein
MPSMVVVVVGVGVGVGVDDVSVVSSFIVCCSVVSKSSRYGRPIHKQSKE